ncbi:Bcr/CflA family drug resistance efflux transporter, partial [Achromobacter xylosoxidans]
QMACAGGMTALASLAGGSPTLILGGLLAGASVLACAALMAGKRQR